MIPERVRVRALASWGLLLAGACLVIGCSVEQPRASAKDAPSVPSESPAPAPEESGEVWSHETHVLSTEEAIEVERRGRAAYLNTPVLLEWLEETTLRVVRNEHPDCRTHLSRTDFDGDRTITLVFEYDNETPGEGCRYWGFTPMSEIEMVATDLYDVPGADVEDLRVVSINPELSKGTFLPEL